MDQMEEGHLPLDGNAAAGLLRELFAVELTSAEITCASCGGIAGVGALRVYGGTMGAIFRCANCDSVAMRLVRTPAGHRFDMRGSRCLFVRAVS